jgi:hypothetical protein
MHPALWKLYRLRIRGLVRDMIRRMKTVRGAALTLFTLAVFGFMFGPNLIMVSIYGRPAGFGDGQQFRILMPFGLLIFCLFSVATSAGERAIYFSSAEIDFLFSGPFTRRQLLVYKIATSVLRAMFMGTVVATASMMVVPSWFAAAAGACLAFLFITALAMCVQMIAQTLNEQTYTRARRLLLGAVLVIVALGIAQVAAGGMQDGWLASTQQFRESVAGRVLLAPFNVYGEIITARRFFPDWLGWSALGGAMVVALYAVSIALDANYLDTAVRVSQQMQERIKRMQRGGAFAGVSAQRIKTSRLPRFPWLGGAGPLARRQLLQAVRTGRGLLLFAVIITVVASVPLLYVFRDRSAGAIPYVVMGVLAYLTFLISAQVPLAFRGDFDQLAVLKTLPMRATAVACGQLIVVVAMATGLQWLVLAAIAAVFPTGAWVMAIAGLFAIPFNLLIFAGENFLFLIFPARTVTGGSAGIAHAGKNLLFMMAKMLLLTVCGAVAAAMGSIALLITNSSFAALAVSWCGLIVPCAFSVWLVGWAFERLDVSSDVAE